MAKLDHIESVYRGEIGDGAPLEVFSSLLVYPGAGSKAAYGRTLAGQASSSSGPAV
jgi:hypothetical protein